jgi:predicted nucleotide-binding protein
LLIRIGDTLRLFSNYAERISRLDQLHDAAQQFQRNLISIASSLDRKIFIVHGRDREPREAVAAFLENIGFESVVLHERANRGRSIITKFREEAADVVFAIVLLTPDDFGGVADGKLFECRPGANAKPRARQNVVFELGFFVGAFGPERVAALVKGDIERPSDFEGVGYISLEDEDWQAQLKRKLLAAGLHLRDAS